MPLLDSGKIHTDRVTCSLKTYLHQTNNNQLTTRLIRTSFIFSCLLFIALLTLLLVNFIPYGIVLVTAFTGALLGSFLGLLITNIIPLGCLLFSLIRTYKKNKKAFQTNNIARDIYYQGLRPWDLGRGAVDSSHVRISRALFSPFQKYDVSNSLAIKMALFMENFVSEPPQELSIDWARVVRDFRPYVRSLFFIIEEEKTSAARGKKSIVCEAFRSDDDAHLAMIDCYHLIHSKLIVEKKHFKNVDILPSVMIMCDYPGRAGEGYRDGLSRVYGGEGIKDFPILVPNERLPMGPLFIPRHPYKGLGGERGFAERITRNHDIVSGLDELLELCIFQRNLFALQWDNISLRRTNTSQGPMIKIRSFQPRVSQISPEYGPLCSSLVQWASVLGSNEQLNWLEAKIKGLTFPKSLGSKDAVVIDETISEENSIDSQSEHNSLIIRNIEGETFGAGRSSQSTSAAEELSSSTGETSTTYIPTSEGTSTQSDNFHLGYALVQREFLNYEPPPEPLVAFTDKEKQLLLEAIDARANELKFYNDYLMAYGLRIKSLEREHPTYGPNRLRKIILKDQKERLEEVLKTRQLRNSILSYGFVATNKRGRSSVLTSLVEWVVDGFDLFRTDREKFSRLKLSGDSEEDETSRNNVLTQFQLKSDSELLYKGIRVIEPGIEDWYNHPDQAAEIRSLLEGLTREGRISGYREDQPCVRYVLRDVSEGRREVLELLENLVSAGEIFNFFESPDEEGSFVIHSDAQKTYQLKRRLQSCVKKKLIGSFADESSTRGRFIILV
ncbi:hypothetical protein C10C_0471 [Chlamydia serpentis]|uniref:Uncharacterized protein n=1 Tax=Chlamydia serpentis TaxID=1967782 RepID=A0A2R8FBG0_9CHLA|nr:hypothetical protein [Chlamydia serpentis]SPN73636.1 hypothetical protein C10C_0471 [Chlamydia serpentis]